MEQQSLINCYSIECGTINVRTIEAAYMVTGLGINGVEDGDTVIPFLDT